MANSERLSRTTAPMGARPRQKRGMVTRQKLLDAAVTIFTRDTVENARIDDIIDLAGVSRGTFFHYFPHKEDLLLALAAVQLGRVRDTIDEKARDPEASTREIVLSGFTAIADTDAPPHLYAAILREVAKNRRRFEAMIGEGTPTYLDVMSRVLARGQGEGEVRDDVPAQLLALMISSMVLSPLTTFPVLVDVPPRSLANMVGAYFNVLWEGIEPSGNKKSEVTPSRGKGKS